MSSYGLGLIYIFPFFIDLFQNVSSQKIAKCQNQWARLVGANNSLGCVYGCASKREKNWLSISNALKCVPSMYD